MCCGLAEHKTTTAFNTCLHLAAIAPFPGKLYHELWLPEDRKTDLAFFYNHQKLTQSCQTKGYRNLGGEQQEKKKQERREKMRKGKKIDKIIITRRGRR